MKKSFILDTNVILHDSRAHYMFDKNDVIIPIVVLEELDNFKKGNEPKNVNARVFIRDLNSLAKNLGQSEFPLGKNKGKLLIPVSGFEIDHDSPIFNLKSTDNNLLALALNLKKEGKDVIFVTKDINLRIKANALGIESQDYEIDKVKDVDELYSGYRTIEVNEDVFARLMENDTIFVNEITNEPVANEFYTITCNGSQTLARNNSVEGTVQKILNDSAAGLKAKNKEQVFALDALLNPEIPLVALSGKAGTGKTLCSIAAALHQKKIFHQIFIARPVVPLGNDIGFLPGDINDKLDPYMQPLYDNLEVMKKVYGKADQITKMLAEQKISVAALPYIRGRSLPSIFFIIDEAQNLTPHEVKTIITRAGEGTKVVFCGDLYQIDTPYLDSGSNGLAHLINNMKNETLFAHVNLVKGERSKLAELASDKL